MTRQLVWKEVREQAAVMIALLALGAGVVVATAVLLDAPSGSDGLTFRSISAPGRMALMMLVLTAGVVAGGTLFAGERESGTFVFLDFLPGSRWSVFWRKVLTGGAMAAIAAAGLWAVAVVAGLLGSGTALVGWGVTLALIAAGGFGWGVFGSVYARNSLAACGLGLGVATGVLGVLYLIAAVGFSLARSMYQLNIIPPRDLESTAGLVAAWGLISIPLPLAWWLYTAPDRSRLTGLRVSVLPGTVRAGLPAVGRPRFGGSIRRLVWLFVRQHRVPAAILAGVGLVSGGAVAVTDAPIIAVWPILSLIFGVLVGVVVVADEQHSTAGRFWGERRLPAGRLWWSKVLGGLAATGFVCLCALAPAVFVALANPPQYADGPPLLARVTRSGVLSERGFPLFTFLAVWPVYGFVFAQLAGLLFHKTLVAGAVGILLAGMFAAVWLPSLLSGGLHGWQVFAPVLVLLLTTRLLIWSWATDRIGTRPAVRRLVVGTCGLLLAVAAGIGYRVVEVPVLPTSDDHVRFAESLPTFDTEQAGRDIRRAINQFEENRALARAIAPRPLRPELPPELLLALGMTPDPSPGRPDRSYTGMTQEVLTVGYPADRPDLDGWLANMTDGRSTGRWEESLALAATKPTGVLDDANEMTVTGYRPHVHSLRHLGSVYLARGLLEQRRGDPADFARRVPVWLAAVRTARKDAVSEYVLASYPPEEMAYLAIDRWLERLDGRPDLIRSVLAAVKAHDAALPVAPPNDRLAEVVVLANAVATPAAWLPWYLDQYRPIEPASRNDLSVGGRTNTEVGLVGFSWVVPWEKERLRRVVGLASQPINPFSDHTGFTAGLPGWLLLQRYRPIMRAGDDRYLPYWFTLQERRAAMLKLAVRLYHAETGKFPAPAADTAVPESLALANAKPVQGMMFGYRVTKRAGVYEVGGWKMTRIAKGQPVIIGAMGGPVSGTALAGMDEDFGSIVFPVPLPLGTR